MSKPPPHHKYWRANIKLLLVLLSIWFLVGCGLSIFWVEPLNRFKIGGFPVGFWIAQQGSTVVFIGLIWIYAKRMSQLDKEHGVEEEDPS